jgi:hypothetical protein
MSALKAFIKGVLWVEAAAVVGLLMSGLILTWAESGHRYPGQGFFTYRIEHMDCLPAWFVMALALMAVNGFWMFRLATIEAFFRTPNGTGWGQWTASLPINPLRLFAINLVAIPAAIGIFLVIRAYGW